MGRNIDAKSWEHALRIPKASSRKIQGKNLLRGEYCQIWGKLFLDENGPKQQTLPFSLCKSWEKEKLFLDGLSGHVEKFSPLNLFERFQDI